MKKNMCKKTKIFFRDQKNVDFFSMKKSMKIEKSKFSIFFEKHNILEFSIFIDFFIEQFSTFFDLEKIFFGFLHRVFFHFEKIFFRIYFLLYRSEISQRFQKSYLENYASKVKIRKVPNAKFLYKF